MIWQSDKERNKHPPHTSTVMTSGCKICKAQNLAAVTLSNAFRRELLPLHMFSLFSRSGVALKTDVPHAHGSQIA